MSFKAVKVLVSIAIATVACTALPQASPPAAPATVTCSTVATGLLSSLNDSKDIQLFGCEIYLNCIFPVTTGWFFDGLNALNFDTRTTGTINVEFQGCTPNPGGFANTPGGQISGKASLQMYLLIDI